MTMGQVGLDQVGTEDVEEFVRDAQGPRDMGEMVKYVSGIEFLTRNL